MAQKTRRIRSLYIGNPTEEVTSVAEKRKEKTNRLSMASLETTGSPQPSLQALFSLPFLSLSQQRGNERAQKRVITMSQTLIQPHSRMETLLVNMFFFLKKPFLLDRKKFIYFNKVKKRDHRVIVCQKKREKTAAESIDGTNFYSHLFSLSILPAQSSGL